MVGKHLQEKKLLGRVRYNRMDLLNLKPNYHYSGKNDSEWKKSGGSVHISKDDPCSIKTKFFNKVARTFNVLTLSKKNCLKIMKYTRPTTVRGSILHLSWSFFLIFSNKVQIDDKNCGNISIKVLFSESFKKLGKYLIHVVEVVVVNRYWHTRVHGARLREQKIF